MIIGTYQEYITSPARYTSRIPDGVDDFSAGTIMCSGSTMFRAVSNYDPLIIVWHSLFDSKS